MRFALVLFLAILSFGVRPAKAQQQLDVRGQLESNGPPGGYLVEVYAGGFWINSGTTDTLGFYRISKGSVAIDPDLLRSSRVICHQLGKYAYSPVDFQRSDSGYVAYGSHLKLLSTTEKKYKREEARETIEVLVNVQGVRYNARKIGTSELEVVDALKVLDNSDVGRNPQARRAFVDNLRFDSNLPSDVLVVFRQYLLAPP